MTGHCTNSRRKTPDIVHGIFSLDDIARDAESVKRNNSGKGGLGAGLPYARDFIDLNCSYSCSGVPGQEFLRAPR